MYKVGQVYRDLRSRLNPNDEYTKLLTYKGSNDKEFSSVNIYRGVKYLNFIDKKNYPFAAGFIFETSKTSKKSYNKSKGEFNNPWTDEFLDNSNIIRYWGDAKYHQTKKMLDWGGCKKIEMAIDAIKRLNYIPPILHFTRIEKGKMLFNGIYGIKKISIKGYLDVEFNSIVQNYLIELKRLETEMISMDWIHNKVSNFEFNTYPIYWQKYLTSLQFDPISLPNSEVSESFDIKPRRLGNENLINEYIKNNDFLGLFSYLKAEINSKKLNISLNELRDLTIAYFA